MLSRVRVGLVLAVIVLGGCTDQRCGADQPCTCASGASGFRTCVDGVFGGCQCLLSDGGDGVDAGDASRDAGELVRDAGRDAGRDAFVPEPDAGADAGPRMGCYGDGSTVGLWCDDLATVVTEYDCELIYRADSVSGEWSGSAALVRSAYFVLQDVGHDPYVLEIYACANPPPPPGTGSTPYHRNACGYPYRTPCAQAEMYESYRNGIGYRSVCDAAEERGLISRFDYHMGPVGCGE